MSREPPMPEPMSKEKPVIDNNVVTALVKRARKARSNAIAHLSNYHVGAALLCDDGAIYLGCNIEFDNYSNTIHAEEVAVASAVADGERKFQAIAIVTGEDGPVWPCGMCRQTLYEVGGPNLTVIAAGQKAREILCIGNLLPHAFRLRRSAEEAPDA